MSGLHIGQRVRCLHASPDVNNRTGTIVYIEPTGLVGVDLDIGVYYHDCDGYARRDHGLWIDSKFLVPLNPSCNYDDY